MAAEAVAQSPPRRRGTTVRPSARGWLALATGAGLTVAGIAAGYPTVRGLGLALLALSVVSLASVLLRLPVSVRRTISPSRVARLDPCRGQLALSSSSTRFGVSLDAQDRVGGRPVDVDVPWLAAGETREVVFDLPTERMGRLTIGPMTLRRNGFAGLWLRVMDLGDTRDLLVTPQLHRCKGVPAGLTRGHAGADERVERGGTDLTGLREYVPGDDLRRLHWATTARTGTLMIREDSDPSRAHLTVLVDDSSASLREPGDLDEMADVAASLLRAAVADGNPCRLVSLSGRADVELPAGIGQAVDPVGVLEPALVALCDLADDPSTAADERPRTPALHGTDVLVAVGSRHSDRTRLATIAGGLRPTLLIIDPGADATVAWAAGSATLSGARARDVLSTWDTVGP